MLLNKKAAVGDQNDYGNRLSDAFGLPNLTLATQTLLKGNLAVTLLRCDQPNLGVNKSMPYEDAFIAMLTLNNFLMHDYWVDGRAVATKQLTAGETLFHDLRRDPTANMCTPFRTLNFYLPRKALNEIADNSGAPRIETLFPKPQVVTPDLIVNQLGLSLLPAFERPNEICSLFVDHTLLAVSAHIAHKYGGMRIPSYPIRGGLAPWQERRAKEILNANLDGEISLIELASECGLSVRHFARAFRQSTGTAPHRWLLARRVEKTKDLLRNSLLSLADIALACGFADQSHFTRVFTRSANMSPGMWRRMRAR